MKYGKLPSKPYGRESRRDLGGEESVDCCILDCCSRSFVKGIGK